MSEEINNTTTSQAEQPDVKQISEQVQNKSEELNHNEIPVNNDLKRDFEPTKEFKEDLKNLQIVLNSGLINRQQAQNLLNHIIKRTLDCSTNILSEDNSANVQVEKPHQFINLDNETPEFFNYDGRDSILNYLKECKLQIDSDELSKISKITEQVEKSAIERYLKKAAHEENIEKSNSIAKQKLVANAQSSKSDTKNTSVFTREQIGKMTSAEFLKNESLIMKQLKAGLIK